MNRIERSLNRREASAAIAAVVTAAAVLVPALRRPVSPRFDSKALSADDWLAINRRELPSLARILAAWEREGIESERPVLWRRIARVGVGAWRRGISLVFGFNGRLPAEQAAGIRRLIGGAGLEILADGHSDDRRAWTSFVYADADQVRKLLAARLSGYGETRREEVA